MSPLLRVSATEGREGLIRKIADSLSTVLLVALTPGVWSGEANRPDHLGLNGTIEVARPTLPRADAIELVDLPSAFTPGRIGKVLVKVSSSSASHQPLIDFPQARQVWIDLRVADATGRELLSSRRILKNDRAVEQFSLVVPANAVGPIAVRAELNYWPFPQKLADATVGPNQLRVGMTRIESAGGQVPLSHLRPKAVEEMERVLLFLAVGHAH